MATLIFDLYYRSDLYIAGITEDGDVFEAESYYLIAETSDGRRFRHNARFDGAKEWQYDDCWGFEDIRDEALAKVERLLVKVKASGTINLDHWVEICARYGSSAYSEAETIAWERAKG